MCVHVCMCKRYVWYTTKCNLDIELATKPALYSLVPRSPPSLIYGGEGRGGLICSFYSYCSSWTEYNLPFACSDSCMFCGRGIR